MNTAFMYRNLSSFFSFFLCSICAHEKELLVFVLNGNNSEYIVPIAAKKIHVVDFVFF